ncbi:cupin [Candidatus Woesearchaeota archaeon]|nr:cupin [Candidatus Woesearchaeota archaeon]|tara:strand:+ start:348 stop:647 length:300 start_codon:yes stop_codon:yes gene_type:complete
MIKNVIELIEYSQDGILSKEIDKSGKSSVTLFCMGKGTELSEHTSTKEGVVYVVEGKGVFNLEGKDLIMSQGVLISMKCNARHSLKVEENTSFLLILTS